MKHLSKEQGLHFLRKAGVIVEYQEIEERYEVAIVTGKQSS